jgi:EAL domain
MVTGIVKPEKRGSLERPADEGVLALLCQPPTPEIEAMLGPLAGPVAYCQDPYGDYVLLPDVYFGRLFACMLSGHREQSKKDLHGLIYAKVCERRLDTKTSSVEALVYDIDGWLAFDEVSRRRDDHAGVTWTTYNHLKKRSTISAHDVVEWRRKRRVPVSSPLTDDEARQFLNEHDGGKKTYLTNVRVSDGGVVREITERGKPKMVYGVEHDSEEKSRSVSLLKEPINLAEVGQDGYRAIYHAVGVDTFGTAPNGTTHYDEMCANPSRLHWNPAHKEGAEDFHVRLHKGEPLDWRLIWGRIVKDIEAQRIDLRALGIRIALDDFGAGYASLCYLRSFPFDKIKIDRSFIRDLDVGQHSDCVAIVHAVAGLAKQMDMTTVAEGVETLDQVNAVVDAGCDELQGYYFSRPVPACEIGQALAQCQRVLSENAPCPKRNPASGVNEASAALRQVASSELRPIASRKAIEA